MKIYDYIEYFVEPNETIKVKHSELLKDKDHPNKSIVIVFFTNEETNAKSKAVLPSFKWLNKGSLSKKDITFCEKVLRWNSSLIMKMATIGGVNKLFSDDEIQ